jgi:deferrochelatase/peroxidase EfeB
MTNSAHASDRPSDPESSGEAPAGAEQAGGRSVLSRRRLLGAAGTGLGVAAAGFAGGWATRLATEPPSTTGTVPFYGPRQAGITRPAQDRLAFASMNLAPGASRSDVCDMLREWTLAAARMTSGRLVGNSSRPTAPPLDTGEAVGLAPSNLTVTLGYGPSFFDHRLGLQHKRPASLTTLPGLPNEELDPAFTGGDLCIQACADDPVVAFHAVRNLARLGMGVVENNWMELGFGRASTTNASESTPRNLQGFKDGTRNITSDDTATLNRYVWVGDETDQSWMTGGSYLVARRIRMFIENWDRDYLRDQENVIGREKTSGAPLSGGTEFTTPDLHARDAQGEYAIPMNAHIRLASRESNNGIQILRRSYSYTDGIDPQLGTLLSGLFFIAFMKDPQQFITLQTRLGGHDALNEYIQHTGSGLFACPPGLSEGEHWGDALFA